LERINSVTDIAPGLRRDTMLANANGADMKVQARKPQGKSAHSRH